MTTPWQRMDGGERARAIVAWVEGYPWDGLRWARPCPVCGAFVTDWATHGTRAHFASFSIAPAAEHAAALETGRIA